MNEEYDYEDQVISLAPSHDEEQDVEDDVSVEEPAATNKPEWVFNGFTVLGIDRVSEGAQVEYVNRVLGVDGKTYSEDTQKAVLEYQDKNGIRQTGRVSKPTYNGM